MPDKPRKKKQDNFVDSIRQAAPYIQAHRGSTFVLMFGGEAVDEQFEQLVHDIALLHTFGIRLVLVHGARPQIEQRLKLRKAEIHYVNGLRITDDEALTSVKDAVGSLRVEIEAQLSMSLVNTPTANAHIGVASGNFVTARPLGIRDGVDYCHTGEVRRMDADGIHQQLDAGRIVLLSPLGYSPTGEVFNLSAEEVATSAAIALHAEKLILLTNSSGLRNTKRQLIRQMTLMEAENLLQSRRKLDADWTRHINHAVDGCRRGVHRTHLIDRHNDGGLLRELLTRDGVGTLITAETYEGMRIASIDDVGGILQLIIPLEESGILVRRSREMLEMEIDQFMVVERDGMIVACAALYPYAGHIAELSCLAVHPDYQSQGRGDQLLRAIERRAARNGTKRLFILTTRTAHWFRERDFRSAELSELPVKRRNLYNYQRKSKVLIKKIETPDQTG
ncbi:N-acetylglutamate synthase [hydrothermal vent metagenome]|uniref:amino-acid N-acetyltransferase n=1 Tax=hydrothermal vent metagenome TaxID=652676 RepID=A0A3B0YUC3_9ZZZZ